MIRPEPEPTSQFAGGQAAQAGIDRVVWTVIGANALIWFLVPTVLHHAPPLDVVEGYTWGREWPLATYKHPAMPSWLIEASRVITLGGIGWPVYLVAQVVTAATLWLTYLLGRELLGAERGAVAAIVMVGVEPLSWMSPSLNHTSLQLPFVCGALLLAWLAVRDGRPFAWLALGVIAALGLYTRLLHAAVLAGIGVWLLSDPAARARLASPWPWLGAVLSVIVLTPLYLALDGAGWQILDYARERGSGRGNAAATFVLRLLSLLAVPAAIALIGLAWLRRRPATPEGAWNAIDQRAVRFLIVATVTPLAIFLASALLRRHGLRTMWGAPLIPGLALLVVALTWHRLFTPGSLGRVARVSILAACVLAVGYGANLFSRVRDGRVTRVNWPQATISSLLAEAWTKATPAPLRIVAGETWVAGLTLLGNSDRPSILTDGRFDRSPWIGGPDGLRRHGALVVWDAQRGPPSPELATLIADRPRRSLRVPARGGSVEIGYAIVPPAGR